jgi:hypothetical protein
MKNTIVTFAFSLALAACGDDRSVSSDSQVQADGSAVADLAPTPDQGAVLDRLVALDQHQAPDLQPTPDASSGPAKLVGSVSLANITCGATPADDCKGTLIVGVVDKPVAPPQSTLLGSTVIAGVDLSSGKVTYEIDDLPGGAGVYVSAMLSESGQLSSPPLPQPGDLVVEPKPTLLTSPSTTVDLQLDARWK